MATRLSAADQALVRSNVRDMLNRAEHARASYAETLQDAYSFSIADARTILATLEHIGVARADPVIGQMEFKHGAFLQHDMLLRVLNKSSELMATRAVAWRKRR